MTPQVRKRRPYAARVPMPERREQLLDAALVIVDRNGYDKVSIDAIAREAGVTRPVVYGAFDDLGTLLGALLDRQQQRAVEQLYAALPLDALDSSAHELVRRTVPALHAMVLDDPMTWRAILATGQAVPAAMAARIESDRRHVLTTIEALVTQTMDGVDAQMLAHAILAVMEHFGRMVLTDPDTFAVARLEQTMLDVLELQRGRAR